MRRPGLPEVKTCSSRTAARQRARHVTTYSGDKGTILGPWATSEIVDTINASTSGTVVMSPSALSNGSHNFGIWLRHQ